MREVMPCGIMMFCALHKVKLSVSLPHRAEGTLHIRRMLHAEGAYRFACETLSSTKTKNRPIGRFFVLVGAGGFEPPKSLTTDLQSAPFGHLGTLPNLFTFAFGGAGGRTRTPDLLITNQLLYQLSYTSKYS